MTGKGKKRRILVTIREGALTLKDKRREGQMKRWSDGGVELLCVKLNRKSASSDWRK